MKRAVLLALVLGGCDITASQERATAERVDAAECSNYGFKPGTADFAKCRMSRDQQRQTSYRTAIEQTARTNNENIESMERSLARPAVNCTGATTGNVTSTSCR